MGSKNASRNAHFTKKKKKNASPHFTKSDLAFAFLVFCRHNGVLPAIFFNYLNCLYISYRYKPFKPVYKDKNIRINPSSCIETNKTRIKHLYNSIKGIH